MRSASSLPSGWIRVQIRDVGRVQLGRQRSPDNHRGTHMRPYLRVANVFEDRIDLSDVMEMNFTPEEASRFELHPGDILLNEGQSKELVGRSAMYRGELPGACFTNSLIRFQPGAALDGEFALQLFRNRLRSGAFQRIAQVTTNIAHLGAGRFAEMDMPLPPLAEQRRIVGKLKRLQSRGRYAREVLDEVPRLLERLRQSILSAAFRGDLTRDWRAKHPDVEPGTELLKRIRTERRRKWEQGELAKLNAGGITSTNESWKTKYENPEPVDTSDLPRLPKGWCWATAIELCDRVVDCHNKTAPYVDAGVPLIRTTNIRNGDIDLTATKFVDEATYAYWSRRCPPEPGDVIFTREAPMGEAGMVPPRTRLCMGQRMMLLRADGELLRRRYLLFAAQAPYVGDYATGLSVGTGVQHLRVGDVESLPLPLAPVEEQKAIELAIDELLAKHAKTLSIVSDAVESLRILEMAFLATAFRGHLVPQAPADEPAETTLARSRTGGLESGREQEERDQSSLARGIAVAARKPRRRA